MPRSVLMLMSQLPQDPASGAPRSDKTICEFLARSGFRVRVLGTTATEQEKPDGGLAFLRRAGIEPTIDEGVPARGDRPVYRFHQRGIDYTILDVGEHTVDSWLAPLNDQFNALLRDLALQERIDIVECYGGMPQERVRRRWLREQGAIIVFHLHNWGYMNAQAWGDVDAVMTPSRFVTQRYRSAIGLESTPMPVPLDEQDVVAPQRKPTFVTFINPTAAKGVCAVARICEDICRKRADIPFMIVNARRTAANLVKAGLNGGFDLRRHPSIVYTEGVPHPRDIFAVTKILLVPSVWEEPAGRVGAEAMINAVPAIVSNRGGSAETLRGGGIVLPLPDSLTPQSNFPISSADAREWVEAIEFLWDDQDEYAKATWRAASAGEGYRESAVAAQFAAYFNSVKRRTTPVAVSAGREPGKTATDG